MLGRLQTKLRDYLGPPLNGHVIIANYRQETLAIHTDSAAWTTRLRYRTRDIQRLFQDDLPGIKTISIKNPPIETRSQTTRQAAKASPRTVEAIHKVAVGMTDPPLRSALLRIADKLSGAGERSDI